LWSRGTASRGLVGSSRARTAVSFITDTGGMRLRRVAEGVIETIVGNGQPRHDGDGGPAHSGA